MERQISQTEQFKVGNTAYSVTLDDGQVRVHLPFSIDPGQFSQQLVREGYGLAHQPSTPDTQGWGNDFDANGYYPYWVYPDPAKPEGYVFAFAPNPEDVMSHADAEPTVALGKRSAALIQRWVPVLESFQRQPS